MAFECDYFIEGGEEILENSYIYIENIHTELLLLENETLNEMFVDFGVFKNESEKKEGKEPYDYISFVWQFEKGNNFGNLWELIYNISRETIRETIQDRIDQLDLNKTIIIKDI